MSSFASKVFGGACVWGIAVLGPMLFRRKQASKDLGHVPDDAPVWYYGFTSIGLTFQLVFGLVATNPIK
eukprot:CAMPEP_0202889604 /NCGR_PEP_ID=MMETSP1392-20130828/188_1 /ASSEMBLY_ACC=CAM_ASM_000868 /TAXON_ID=225041 /ORGANISM="Chlamydomonas chlamydogama, Strain SAG 11-48b" /LENGTH=68 /DNA_ID=CAMNT_0049572971 /DNA_START=86 /DNA_END=292 /DNA_ORIENTATION=+